MWVVLSAATMVVVFASEAIPTWIGVLPFLNLAIAYLCYRDIDPLKAIKNLVSGTVLSSGRGWIYGIAAAAVIVLSLRVSTDDEVLDANQWAVWPVLAIALLVGVVGAQRNPIKALGTGIVLVAKLAIFLLLVGIGLGVLLLGFSAVSSFFANYGMLGVIAFLLVVIIYKLDQLIRRPAR